MFGNHKMYYSKSMSKDQAIFIFVMCCEGSVARVGKIGHVGRRQLKVRRESSTSMMGVDSFPLPPVITEVSDRFALVAYVHQQSFSRKELLLGVSRKNKR